MPLLVSSYQAIRLLLRNQPNHSEGQVWAHGAFGARRAGHVRRDVISSGFGHFDIRSKLGIRGLKQTGTLIDDRRQRRVNTRKRQPMQKTLENRMNWSARIPLCHKSVASSIFLLPRVSCRCSPLFLFLLLLFEYLRPLLLL